MISLALKKDTKPPTILNIVQFDLVKSNFGERFGYKLDYVIVVHNLIDVAFVVGARQNYDFTLVSHHLVKFLELVKKNESIHDRHVNVKKDQTRQIISVVLVFAQIVKRGLTRTLHFYPFCELSDLDDPFTDEVISIVIIYKHY
jgi:hypothetical protein